MKKLLGVIFAGALLVSSVSAASRVAGGGGNMLIGLTFPQTSFKLDDWDDKVKQSAVGAEIGYMNVNSLNGFTFKGVLQNNVAWTKDLREDDTDVAYNMVLDAGLGWSPVHTNQFSLSFLGMVGFGFANYKYDYKYIYDASYNSRTNTITYYYKNATATNLFYDFHIGLDGTAIFYINNKFGLYGNLGFRFGFGGDAWDSGAGSSDTISTTSTTFIPTIGCVIKM